MKRIYLDNAASTPMSEEVILAMQEAMGKYSGNPSSIHLEGRTARAKIEESRKKIAKLLNASIGEIFFTSGGTESNNTAIKCAVRDLGITRIISSSIEHHAVTHSVEAMYKSGIEIVYLNVDHKGRLDMHHLEESLASSSSPTSMTTRRTTTRTGTGSTSDTA